MVLAWNSAVHSTIRAMTIVAQIAILGMTCRAQTVTDEATADSDLDRAIQAGIRLLVVPTTAWEGYSQLLQYSPEDVGPTVVDAVFARTDGEAPGPVCRALHTSSCTTSASRS